LAGVPLVLRVRQVRRSERSHGGCCLTALLRWLARAVAR
jgi:hypothetical protein